MKNESNNDWSNEMNNNWKNEVKSENYENWRKLNEWKKYKIY